MAIFNSYFDTTRGYVFLRATVVIAKKLTTPGSKCMALGMTPIPPVFLRGFEVPAIPYHSVISALVI
jgi:hypothetical protein